MTLNLNNVGGPVIDKCCTKLNSRRQPSQQKFEETTELQRTVAIKSSVSENMDGILDKEGISNEGLYTGIKTCALFIMHFSFWFQALLKLTKGVKKEFFLAQQAHTLNKTGCPVG